MQAPQACPVLDQLHGLDPRAPPAGAGRRRPAPAPRPLGEATLAAAWAGAAFAAVAAARAPPTRRCWGRQGGRGLRAARASAVAAEAPAAAAEAPPALDVARLRADFPVLRQQARPGVPLVYLDNAATSQKPTQVMNELSRFYREDNSNVHRGMHTLSMRSTEAFEGAREKVAKFINAADVHEVIFTRNATEAINVVARTWARASLNSGDEVIMTVMEHHSNLVPWQQLAEEKGVVLRFVGMTPEGRLDREQFEQLLSERTRLVAMVHVSNVLGCVNPVEWVAERAHAVGAKVLVDACQSVPHMPVDVQRMGVDWLVASSHKMCGPTGIGFLWGRAELLRGAPPFLGGGEMIDKVSLEGSTYADIPHKLEAGTPAFAEAVALGAACDYLSAIGMEAVSRREHELTAHLWGRLAELPGVTLYGPPPSVEPQRASLCTFNVEGCAANDLATLVDADRGVAMRAGHHCCQPLHQQLGVTASARVSAYFYNTEEEIDVAVEALRDAISMLRGEGLMDMDELIAAAEATAAPQWGDGLGPATALEALSERGLVEGSTWRACAGGLPCPLSRPAAADPARVAAAFCPAAGGIRPGDLPALALLRWCQLYGHSPVCLVDSAAAAASAGAALAEELDRGAQGLRAALQRALRTEVDACAAVIVDSREWFEAMPVLDFVREVSSGAPPAAAGSGSAAGTTVPLLRRWSAVQMRERHGVQVFASGGDGWDAAVAGLELHAQRAAAAGAEPAAGSGCLAVAPPPREALAALGPAEAALSPEGVRERLLAADDAAVPALLRLLTALPLEEVERLERSLSDGGCEPGSVQRRLADEACQFLFGE